MSLAPIVDAEIVEARTVQEWADAITGEWRKTVEGIFATGQALIRAKADLGHGEYGRLFCSRECRTRNHVGADHVDRPVPFSARTGQVLMSLLDPVKGLTNTQFIAYLPPAWGTLQYLVKLPKPVLTAHIARGVVHPELKQTEAFKLWREWKEDAEAELVEGDEQLESPEYVAPEARLLHGEFQDRLTDLPDESVDLIFTDPPYPRDALPLYGDLSRLARRVLKPKGLLLAYAGNIFIPEVLAHLSSHLTYGWTFCLLMDTGTQSRIRSRHIIQAWKPILAFSTGSFPTGEWQKDVVVNPEREKSLYEWQQGIAPARELIRGLTSPGSTVLDPFMGTGTTGVAALELGRQFVGCERDSKRFRLARDRIEELSVSS